MSAKPKPFHVMLNPKARERLARLQKLSEAETKSEVIRRALLLYEIALKTRAMNGRIVVETETTTQEVLIL